MSNVRCIKCGSSYSEDKCPQCEKSNEKPWRDEQNRYMEYYNGYPIVILRQGFSGAYNGYVGLPTPKGVYRNSYMVGIEDMVCVHWNTVRINGRRTRRKDFGKKANDHYRLPKKLFPVGNLNLIWFGFDTAHISDKSPFKYDPEFRLEFAKQIHGEDTKKYSEAVYLNKFTADMMTFMDFKEDIIYSGVYRDLEWMKTKCRELADQIDVIVKRKELKAIECN